MTVAQRILIFGGGGITFGTLISTVLSGGNPDWNYVFAIYIGLIALVILAHLRKWE